MLLAADPYEWSIATSPEDERTTELWMFIQDIPWAPTKDIPIEAMNHGTGKTKLIEWNCKHSENKIFFTFRMLEKPTS